MDLVKLASCMRHARGFLDLARFIQVSEAGVGVCLQQVAKILEVLLQVNAFPVERINEPNRQQCFDAGGPIIANISPELVSLGSATTWLQHRNWRVVSIELAASDDMPTNSFNQWRKQQARCSDPTC